MAEDVKYTIELEAEEIEKRLNEIPQMQEDIEYLKENGGGGGGGIITETDPTVPAWAKQPTKPTYTAEEVGALPADTVIPEEVYIGEEAPTDENIKIWIDPNDEEKLPLSAFENDVGFITEDDLPEIPEAPQSDMGQNDPTAADYIKNRLVYKTYEQGVVFEANVTADQQKTYYNKFGQNLIAGETYEVVWNGQSYNCAAVEVPYNGITAIAIGNFYAMGGANTGEPFLIGETADTGQMMIVNLTGAAATVTINGKIEKYHRIDGYEPYFDFYYIDVIHSSSDDSYTTAATPRETIPLLSKGRELKLRIYSDKYAEDGSMGFANIVSVSYKGQYIYFSGGNDTQRGDVNYCLKVNFEGDVFNDPYIVTTY